MKNRLTILLTCFLLAMLASSMNTSAVVAQEKTLVVNSTADGGFGTLRKALQDAHSGATITFDPAVFPPSKPATIFLKAEDDSSLPNVDQGNITLDASNAGVILDGSNISGDWVNGLEVYSDGNIVQGLQIINFSGSGIVVGGDHNVIGGDRDIGEGPFGQGNLVGRNYNGVNIISGASYNTVTGNLVGTNVTGIDEMANHALGIWIESDSHHNTIGPGNIIAHNGGAGIGEDGLRITGRNTTCNTITQNSIYYNEGKGIHLLDGGNIELPAPTILDFDLAAGTITGSAGADCTVELFSDNSNEGRVYEGQTTADSSGFFTFSKGASLAGPNLTATATDINGNTSGFSRSTSAMYTDRIVTDDEVWQDETITTYKMIIVKSGASLTLRNVTLTFDSPTDEECSIIAEPGSSLAIYNSTLSRPTHLELGGLFIQVENASFVMKNSVLDGASRQDGRRDRDWGYHDLTAALTLDHVRNAVIDGNIMKHIRSCAIELHDVSDSVITNNTITPLRQVIENYPQFLSVWDSRNNTITDNYINGVARIITMRNHSTGNYVAGNEITPFRAGHLAMGITLNGDSNNNIFTDNKILGPSGCTAFRIFTRNNVITNNTISDLNYGILIAPGADGNIVANNNLSHIHVQDAILVYRSNGNYIINNNISSSIRGISVSRFSCNNVVQANTVSNSRQGILISNSSDNNLIVNNEVSKNKVGIMVYKSSENRIYDNSFIGNSQQGYDDGVNNWSWGNKGNYWSDNRGEAYTAYDISPAGIDENPLTESVAIVPVQVPEPAPLTFREVYQIPHKRITDEVKYEDVEILMENSYIIMDGGKLILENVTLRSFKEAAEPYWIFVGSGGSLIISNSRIIAPETGIAPIYIEADRGSTLVIKDSELHNVDAGMHDGGPWGAAIYIQCEGAVVEGNIITGSRTGINLAETSHGSARIENNTFEGCLHDISSVNPFASHVIEGNTIIDPVPAEHLSGFFTQSAAMYYRVLIYWLRDPRVIAGISVIGIGAITLGVFLFRRRRRRKARATATG